MKITDEMVEAACEASEGYWGPSIPAVTRQIVRNRNRRVLEAGLAAQPDTTSLGLSREEIRAEVDQVIRNAYYAAWRESRKRPTAMAPRLDIDWTQPGGVQILEVWKDGR